MLKKLIDSCQTLSDIELDKVTHFLWDTKENITHINYTFNQVSVPAFMRLSFDAVYPDTSFVEISPVLADAINLILQKWLTGCNELIRFNYIALPDDNFSGIIFESCHFHANTYVAGSSNSYIDTSILVRGRPKALITHVCLPKTLNPHDLYIISHEIGHALGLRHFHDVPSIKNRLLVAFQGLGCSVMPYPHLLKNVFSNNQCLTPDICQNENYALFPGPLDYDACSKMYDPNKSSISASGSLLIEVRKNIIEGFVDINTVSLALYEGVFIGVMVSLQHHIEQYYTTKNTNKFLLKGLSNTSVLIATMFFYSRFFPSDEHAVWQKLSTFMMVNVFVCALSRFDTKVSPIIKKSASLLFFTNQLVKAPLKTAASISSAFLTDKAIDHFFTTSH